MSNVPELDQADCARLVSLLKEVERSAHGNEVHYGTLKSNETSESIRESFCEIKSEIHEFVLPIVKQLYTVCHKYDVDVSVRANGVRSWLGMTEKLASMLLSLSAQATYKRNSVFFRESSFSHKIRVHSEYLCSLRSCLQIVQRLTTIGSGDSVICDANLDSSICVDDIVDVISEMRQIDVAKFCGRTSCFHFCDSAQGIARLILLAFATFSAAYGPASPIETGQAKSEGAGFLSLLADPDVLCQQVLWALANFDLGLVKRFWRLGDSSFLLGAADMVLPTIAMSHGINLHSIPLSLVNNDGDDIALDPPSIFSGVKPIKARILSGQQRLGQEYWLNSDALGLPPSDSIVFQVHGGGFICQSAKAQEIYLRQFCLETNVPFFCVDYSLLPEDPFPRAVEEVVYAYLWMTQNFSKLGTTGKRIVMLGDSAGGALILATCIKLIELKMKLPDAVLLVYPYACSSFAPSPSRILALADPIVPIPLLVRCCVGYANLTEEEAHLVLGIGHQDHDSQLLSTMPRTANFAIDDSEDGCPETPIPAPEERNHTDATSVDDVSSGHRRTTSAPNIMTTSKTVPTSLSGLFPRHNTSSECSSHARNKSDCGLLTAGINFRRLRMSESERSTLADLLSSPVFTNPLFSPLMASDEILLQLPYLHIVGSTSDPLLDDGVALCKKLRGLGNACDFTAVEGVPHGFLNLALVSTACAAALNKVGDILKDLVSEPSKSVALSPYRENVIQSQRYARFSLYSRAMGMLSSFNVFNMVKVRQRFYLGAETANAL